MDGLFNIFRRDGKRRAARSGRVKTARQRRESIRSQVEVLERRSMLAVTVNEPTPGEVVILYNQPDPVTGIAATSDQHVTIEIENIGNVDELRITRVNIYTASNPTAQVFTNIGLITVTVPNYDSPGVNNNSLAIKGINIERGTEAADRIIMTGAGRTAAGRWSDQDVLEENQVLLEIAGIDDLTLTAGGIINVSGAYTNDTNDASIKAFGTEPELYPQQHNGTVVVAENTPVPGTLPQPGLFSNFIEIVGGELDILGDIVATDHVILRAGEKTDVGQSLVLPYDVTVTGSVVTPAVGRLELYSTKNIVQLQGSTLTAGHLVAVSNDADVDAPAGPWMIDLGSENNDFDTIALGMVSAPGDTPTVATEGRIGVRDQDDLTVSDFGILAATGQVRIDAAGALTFASPIEATGLIGESDHSITSTDGAIMRLGVLGIELYANDSFDDTATGDVTLRGPIVIDSVNAAGIRDTTLVSNKIQATGNTAIVGGIYSPLAGTTTITSNLGILVDGPIQGGSTQLTADSKIATVYDHDLMLISHAGAITVNDRPGGDAVPRTIQATNIVSFDALETITIGGAVYAGTQYGNALALPESEALPAITIIGDADVIVTATGSLETQAYENNADLYSNPLLGRISIDATTQFELQGWIKADGPVDITSDGDIYLYGTTTARELIDVESRQGSLDVQGAVATTGWIYTTTPPAPLVAQRTPDIILSAPQGGITTSVLGTISAGTMTVADVDTYGTVVLESSQDIVIRADIDTDGAFRATTKTGSFQLGALLRTGRDLVPNSDLAATISAYSGIIGGILPDPADPDDPGSEFGQIQTERLDITVTSFDGNTPADIRLTGPGNRLDRLLVRNFSPGGTTTIVNDTVYDAVTNGPVLDLSLVDVVGDFSLTSNSTIAIDGMAQSTKGDIEVIAQSGGINVQSTVRAPGGAVTLTASGQIVQRGGSVTTLYLLSGGRNYTYAIITVDPPPGAGDRALVNATITPYPSPPPVTNKGDGVTGFISALTLLNGGWGYPSGSRVGITIEGDGDGAAAVAETTIMTSSIEARDDVTLTGGDGITLVSAVRSAAGSVAMTATLGDVSVESITAGNNVDVSANRGRVALVSVGATKDINLDAEQGVRVTGTVTSTDGNIAVETVNGDLNMPSGTVAGDAPEPTFYAKAGSISLTSQNGAADVRNLNAGTTVTVTTFNSMTLSGEIASQTADIVALSTSGGIFLDANLVAEQGGISLESQTFLLQGDATGIQTVQVVDPGSVIQAAGTIAPAVTITIAPPRAGGEQATAEAVLAKRAIGTGGQDEWYLASVRITNPGSGYALGETPITTVTGLGQAIVQAFGPTNMRTLSADTGIDITSGNDVTLLYEVSTANGNITIASTDGDLLLGADTFFAHALAGGVTLTSDCGIVVVEKVCAAEDIVITGEQGVDIENEVESEDGNVVVSAEMGEANLRNVYAGLDVTVDAGDTVTLLGVIDSDAGDISLTSRNRDLDFTASGAQLHALQGGVALAALNGTIMSPPTLNASKDVTLTSFNTLALNNEITSDTGVIDLKSTSGSVNLGANLNARDDSIRINAKGAVTQIGGGLGMVRMITGGSGYTAATTVTIAAPSSGTGVAARALPIIGRVNGVSGVITGIRLTSPGSGYGAGEQPLVTFTRNATPPANALEASAIAVASPALGTSGLAAIDVTAGGSGYDATTTITIAAPAGGGTAATAQAVIGSVSVDGVTTDGVIVDIVIVNPGSGYGAGEQPAVTITGNGTGAVARAIANITLQDIRAGQDIDVYAGTGVVLLNTVRADQGHVTITSESGNINLAARTLLVSSFADDIEITARRGAIAAQRLAAEGDITLKAQTGVTLLNAVNSTGEFGTGDVSIYTVNGNIAAVAPNGLISVQNGGVALESVNGQVLVPQVFNVAGDISLKTFGNQVINQPLTSTAGSVTVASATGSVTLAANVFADDRVTITAKTGIQQTKGFMQGDELVARNASTGPVAIGNALNDFANVSVMSLGAVTYVDANDFETGVERDPYSGTPLGVEMMGSDLQISSVAPYSRIRVVSGLNYRTLAINAGTQSNATRGYVEYVTTSGDDNPQANAAFQGTLRDMIRYANDNSATYLNAENTRVSQPQMMVFDEFGYTVEEVKLGAALPAFLRPVFFDGGRLEEAATVDRVGIAGNAAIAYGLAFAPAVAAVPGRSPAYPGSAGSTIQHVAAYGFTSGSAIVLSSGNNTVLDLHAGLKADGTVSGNFIGLDVSGGAAVNNQIGAAVFDPDAVNRFAGNSSAGILIRNGAAGTRVYGSVIGDDTGVRPELANGDGIRITNATRNWIGTPDEVQVDLTPSRSNLIMGNKLAGIQITNAIAGTVEAANQVRNNYIAGNRTGVGITASRFAVLGGLDEGSANVIVGQTGTGVAVAGSANVQIRGNRVGVVPAFGFDAEAVRGNVGNGIAVTGKTSAIEISAGNWIGGNTGSGVVIGAGASGVTLAGNTIGGELADGTSAGNGVDGVAINASIGNVVGIDNTITRNARHGVSVTDSRAATLMAGNKVFGSTIAGNGSAGVFVSGGGFTTVGGTTAGTANVITANAGHGIRVEASTKTGAATGIAIQGNFVGTNDNSEVNPALGNARSGISLTGAVNAVVSNNNVVMNNAGHGIVIANGTGITIGAATAAAGNVITDNAGDGVNVSGKATGVTVMGNELATQGGDGVEVAAGVRGVRIGQTVTQQGVTGAANVIRENAGWGVRIGANAQQIGVQGNSFYDNVLGAMTLGTGANAVAPATVTISSALMRTASGGIRQVVLTGSLVGAGIQPRQQYSVDVYASPADALDPQARRFLGRFTVTATTAGRVNFSNIVIAANVAVNEQITATATSLVFDPGSTSRFSAPVRARLR